MIENMSENLSILRWNATEDSRDEFGNLHFKFPNGTEIVAMKEISLERAKHSSIWYRYIGNIGNKWYLLENMNVTDELLQLAPYYARYAVYPNENYMLVKEVRNAAGMTQEEFAKYTNLPVDCVRNREEHPTSGRWNELDLIIQRLITDGKIKEIESFEIESFNSDTRPRGL